MKTSQRGLDLIKKWEGFKKDSYLCPAGIWTIGYGTTEGVVSDLRITRTIAENLLKYDISRFEADVNRLVKVPLTQNQFDALVSFTYNLGPGNLGRSTLLRKLNEGKYSEAAKEFDRWVNAGGIKLQGLVNRRKDERELFEASS